MTPTELTTALTEIHTGILRGYECLCIDEKKMELLKQKKKMEAPDFWNNQGEAKTVTQRISFLTRQIDTWEGLTGTITALLEMTEMLTEGSPECAEIQAEYEVLKTQYESAEDDLLFSGDFDEANAILEINAGAGGTEAQDWAEMLLRMYLRFAERNDLSAEILEKTNGNEAGIKSALLEISGERAFGFLKGEKGTHRLVRLSPFNAKNLRQTSFAGVIVTPIVPEQDNNIIIEEKDIRVDTFRSSGAGGQHVNTTDSAIRITHLETKIVVECQNQRSQHQNKDKAMEVLRSKLLIKKREEEEAKAREIRGEITDAGWGTQIRNYVLHPYKMVKDLRSHWESGNPDAFLDGDISDCIESVLQWEAEQRHQEPE